MRIAVIGDYSAPEYRELIVKIKTGFPEDIILDLSVHHKGQSRNKRRSRQEDIATAHIVVISEMWLSTIEPRKDVPFAQSAGKECFIERFGQFHPFPEYAERL
jgi:hypothetical protein